MIAQLTRSAAANFLGAAPRWYKVAILGFLIVNPIVYLTFGGFFAGWLIVAEFIFTLAMALTCYPLQPGGLIAIEAVALGLASPDSVFHEAESNFSVILLLMFMVAGIYFLRELLLLLFTKLLVAVRSKLLLSLTFMGAAAVLSAFLDALTVAAVIIAVATGFYTLYHRFASRRGDDESHDHADDGSVHEDWAGDLDRFRAFLRSILMHAMVGTAMGGLSTIVGEPQNLLIGEKAGWEFTEFFLRMLPISLPVFVFGLLTAALLERIGRFGYGAKLPDSVRTVMVEWDTSQSAAHDPRRTARLVVQAVTALLLVVALALHVAEVGLVGLGIIVLATAFNGVINERSLGHAFEEALPFTALLVTFFAVVAVIHDQELFRPVIDLVLGGDGLQQLLLLFGATGVLSAISDNVFVATVYINEVEQAFQSGLIDRTTFDHMAITINAGTNVPSVATPNGQAAFLFLLTSALAPLIRLGYLRMLAMALPYAIVLSAVAIGATALFIPYE
ncbi:MAG: sodium/proton antiporter NhaB [Actinomycetales bacterium]|nr:sodium/proton antiporter NhaB [Actinomycetales bacterium]